MSEYYAVQRSEEYLEHYGIKGMKWGVRKARASGNSRALGRQYRKAQKKLAKLEKRAANGKKYAKRAAAYGAAAAAAGGLAAVGTGGVSRLIRRGGSAVAQGNRIIGNAMSKLGTAAVNYGGTGFHSKFKKAAIRYGRAVNNAGKAVAGTSGIVTKGARGAANAVVKWGGQKALSENAQRSIVNAMGDAAVKINKHGGNITYGQLRKSASSVAGLSNNTIARIGAGALGAGLGVAAARNAYRAATTKRAAKKAAQFRAEMNKAFAGTQYANGGTNRQGKKRRKHS